MPLSERFHIGSQKRIGGYVYLHPPDSSMNNSPGLEKTFFSDNDDLLNATNENLGDELMEIADAINLDAFNILNKRHNESKLISKKKNKPYYIRKNPLPRILKRDFRRDFVVMFRNVINAGDQSLLNNFFVTFAHPECHFVSYNSSLTKVYTPVIQRSHGIHEIVDNLAHRTLPYADFALSILSACIIQKEGMTGSKIMTQMEFRATQVLIPAPSSLAKLDSFCVCQESDRFRITTAKAKIASYVNNSSVLFATKVDSEQPPNETVSSHSSHSSNSNSSETKTISKELAPSGPTPTFSTSEKSETAHMTSSKPIFPQNSSAFPMIKKLQQAGVHPHLVALIEYILIHAQGVTCPPSMDVLHEIKTQLHSFFQTPTAGQSQGQPSSSHHPLLAMMSNKVDALQQLQFMRETIVQQGGFHSHIHPIVVTTMLDTIRHHCPFLPMNGTQFASMFATASGTTGKTTPKTSNKLEDGKNSTVSLEDDHTLPKMATQSSSTSAAAVNGTGQSEESTTSTATSSNKKRSRRALENVLFIDVEMLITQMQLFYSNSNDVNNNKVDMTTSESDGGEQLKSTTSLDNSSSFSSSSNLSSEGSSDVDRSSSISSSLAQNNKQKQQKKQNCSETTSSEDTTEEEEQSSVETLSKPIHEMSTNKTKKRSKKTLVPSNKITKEEATTAIERVRSETPVDSKNIASLDTSCSSSANHKRPQPHQWNTNFDQSVTFDLCMICGKNKFPTPKVLEALMKPFYMNMSLRPIGTFYFNEENQISHMELVTPKVGCSYAISFE